jgi:hypothetical protein
MPSQPPPYKSCPYCDHAYSRAEWDALPSIGAMVDAVERVTLKNCHYCPSTMGVAEPVAL